MQYTIEDLVRLARRDNNSIRPYLYVNPLQGKHIPTDPKDIFLMCESLAKKVKEAYPQEKLYVVGFAETATGVASSVCRFLDNVEYYQNTTREYREDEEYFYFTESHSHAKGMMLRSSGVLECMGHVDRVVFIDDEVTTGNTICKLIDVITKEKKNVKLKFSIVSLLNSMTDERIEQLEKQGIECVFLAKMPFEYKKESVMDISIDQRRHTTIRSTKRSGMIPLGFSTKADARSVLRFSEYNEETNRFVKRIMEELSEEHYTDLLVLGTEEFMYPAICLGGQLNSEGVAENVRVHATTRSPIIASGEPGYPLFYRYKIRSVYDDMRETYIYNLKTYDKVIIVTDSSRAEEGVSDLANALRDSGNGEIMLAQWRYTK